MCSCKIIAAFAAVMVCAVEAQYQYSSGDITHRAAERTRYETELQVSCDTGDDRACFELFISLNRMYLAIAAGVLGVLILVGICICCCCCCKRRRSSRQTQSRFARSGFEAVVVHPADSRSKQSLLPHKTP